MLDRLTTRTCKAELLTCLCVVALKRTCEGHEMDGEFHQLASAMLVLVFAAVMLVTGLLYIERSGRPFDAPIRPSSVLGSLR